MEKSVVIWLGDTASKSHIDISSAEYTANDSPHKNAAKKKS